MFKQFTFLFVPLFFLLSGCTINQRPRDERIDRAKYQLNQVELKIQDSHKELHKAERNAYKAESDSHTNTAYKIGVHQTAQEYDATGKKPSDLAKFITEVLEPSANAKRNQTNEIVEGFEELEDKINKQQTKVQAVKDVLRAYDRATEGEPIPIEQLILGETLPVEDEIFVPEE